MKKSIKWALVALAGVGTATAGVVINEVLVNPPGSLDDTREYIELLGTPGKKLDGYAIALVNGALTRYYPLGSIPPRPLEAQEIDEFFSLDGLSLGANGMLVIGIGTSSFYPTLLPDTNFQRWNTIWNGGLDDPGKLNNDGSNTIMLIRNRPGITQADPTNPAGLLWGKDVNPDDVLTTPVVDPQTGLDADQYGSGDFTIGQPNNIDGDTRDFKGESTPGIDDDLEIVDEVSWEHERGIEYDIDRRRVDVGSASGGLQERRVHTLDDPQGFNPDALSRVDYRTQGDGWTPVAGAVGQMANGNNWQDTATEQWIRGETVLSTGGVGALPQIFYSNLANSDPDSVQPYGTNVPLWLDNGSAPDFDFTTINYQLMAGRLNPLAVAYIPGDVNRDGICDADDIATIAQVFGDADWIFSNSYASAPEGHSGDPATQIRPWDVDQTGDNGIEPSDLQWVLNFQGSTDGRIVGVTYDSTTPTAVGVHLNPNTGVGVSFSFSTFVPSGRPLSALQVGDTVEVTVRAQVSSGANTLSGQENGVMQVVHDALLNTGGVLELRNVSWDAANTETRAALVTFEGLNGDLGASLINGHTTSFIRGLGSADDTYTLEFEAVGDGSTALTIAPASHFTASTPHGVKVGHTASNGNPASSMYPPALSMTVTGSVVGDCDGDGGVGLADLLLVLSNFGTTGPDGDCDGDGDVGLADLLAVLSNFGA